MWEKLKQLARRYDEIGELLEVPEIYADPKKLRALTREQKELSAVVETYRAYQKCEDDIVQALELVSDPELKDMAQEELNTAKAEKERLFDELRVLLLPRDPNDDKNVIVEIRGGVGGEESALFAADLYRMYAMYAEKRGYRVELLNYNDTELGGVKEADFIVSGDGAYSRFKFESGVHRVQRVPETETQGRIHTSTVTVAVMPEALVIVDSLATVQYASPAARRFGIIHDQAMALAEIRDIVKLVSTDSVVRERELTIPLHGRTRTGVVNTNGKGVEAGKPLPEDTLYLHVRVGQIADNLFAIFISDMSEQRRFEIMRRDFVTNVSHELKTPAGAISLLAETIGDAADDPDAVKYFSGRISKESERLTELVHRLIDLQKAQSAAAMLNAERLSVLSVAREALAENQVKAESKHISLVLSVNGRQVLVHANAEELAKEAEQNLDVFVVADHETIKTAVKNLVENAINYSPEHTTVAVGIGIESGKVAIRVVDQGIGIPAASLSRIFERFYRVDPARSRETGGTGLGLAITKHCVEDCGGTISVWSREGEGSTFTITMPQASGATEPDHPADSANDNTREKKQSGHSTTTENEENH